MQSSVSFVSFSDLHLSSSAGQRPRDCVAFIDMEHIHAHAVREMGREGQEEERHKTPSLQVGASIHPAELSTNVSANTSAPSVAEFSALL